MENKHGIRPHSTPDPYLREERIVVGEPVSLLQVTARPADVEHGLNVGVHEPSDICQLEVQVRAATGKLT